MDGTWWCRCLCESVKKGECTKAQNRAKGTKTRASEKEEQFGRRRQPKLTGREFGKEEQANPKGLANYLGNNSKPYKQESFTNRSKPADKDYQTLDTRRSKAARKRVESLTKRAA